MDSRAGFLAKKNRLALSQNRYPGRMLVMGRSPDGQVIFIYVVTGRSSDSQNRVMTYDQQNGRLFTEPADPSKVRDGSNRFYDAMLEHPDHRFFAISNGVHTADIVQFPGANLIAASIARAYEDDSISTPRIMGTCALHVGEPSFHFAMLRRSFFGDESCQRFAWDYEFIESGFGLALCTYNCDGDPPPHFDGEPMILPIGGNTAKEIAQEYRGIIMPENFVTLAVKSISLSGKSTVFISNRFTKVVPQKPVLAAQPS